MRLLIAALTIFICTVMLTACGTTKVFFRDCEKVENGFVCEK